MELILFRGIALLTSVTTGPVKLVFLATQASVECRKDLSTALTRNSFLTVPFAITEKVSSMRRSSRVQASAGGGTPGGKKVHFPA